MMTIKLTRQYFNAFAELIAKVEEQRRFKTGHNNGTK